jgi:uncharacterized protein YqgQ
MMEDVSVKTLYDVQQLLKKFGIYVYVGRRLWDIELMALELDNLHQSHVIDDQIFIKAKLVLAHEHHLEEKREEKKSGGDDFG